MTDLGSVACGGTPIDLGSVKDRNSGFMCQAKHVINEEARAWYK